MGARILVVDDSPTIRKVVQSILEARSYEAVTAEDGQDAIDKLGDEKVDLVLLDFVMPRMNGYQFCRELRANDAHKELPVVLMSAKGDKIRGQFVQQTGAIDAITKPFDARGLIAVVEGALAKQKEGRTRPVPDAAAMPEEDTIADSLRPSMVGGAPSDPQLKQAQALERLSAAIAQNLAPELASLAASSDTDSLTSVVRSALTQDVLAEIGPDLDVPEGGGKTVLSGDISVISIAEVLQLLHLQRQTGALSIKSRKQEVTLFIREGNVDLAMSKGVRDEFLLGRFFVEDHVVGRDELEGILKDKPPGETLGDRLMSLAKATAEQVQGALERQTSELIFEVVRWKKGRFSFSVEGIHPAAESAKLGLSTGALVMEGFRRVDEWRLIEGSFDFDDVLYKDQGAIDRMGDDNKLTDREAAVLDKIDGERTVREIVDEIEGSSFELSKIVYQFLNSRLVRQKGA